MNPTERLRKTYDGYAVDEAFTDRVLDAAVKRPRRRVTVRVLVAAALILCLVGAAAAAGSGLLDRRLQTGEDNPLVSDDRVPGYLAEHVQGDVVLEGTVEGLHVIYTNLLVENRFLYFEVLAEREDGGPIDAEALRSDMFFKYLRLSDYETAVWSLSPPPDNVGWVGSSARIDDGTEPGFVHYAVALTLMRHGSPLTDLTLELTTGERQTQNGNDLPKEVLSSVTISIPEHDSLRCARLPDGREVYLGALGAELQLRFFADALADAGTDFGPSDYGVILRDGSRVCFRSNWDLSWYAVIAEEDLWAAAPFTEIIDPSEVVALYGPEGEYPVE